MPTEDDDLAKKLAGLSNQFGLGPTGDYPEGKLAGDDDGGLKIMIGENGDNVVIAFGVKVAWLAMGAKQALALADAIRRKAESVLARKKRGGHG